MSESVRGLIEGARAVQTQARVLAGMSGALVQEAEALLEQLPEESTPEGPPGWVFPVGTVEYPPEAWYCATVHDPTGKKNGGYEHTGLDINLDRRPWGDVDRGLPVFAVAEGTVVSRGANSKWLAVVVLRVEHEGKWLYVRYAHLDPERIEAAKDQVVNAGDRLGYLGDYKGGDHLHFDMALDLFLWDWWLTAKVRWVDPVPILKKHLDPGLVETMVGRRDG